MDELSNNEANKQENRNPFTSVPIEVSVCVGKARPLIKDLVNLGENAVLMLDKSVDDPVALYIGDRLIAARRFRRARCGKWEPADGKAD